MWKVPLSQVCDDIIGNSYSITNFLAASNVVGQKHYPIVVEFKMKTVEQTVKRHAEVNTTVWADSSSDDDQQQNRRKRARHEP